MDSDSSLGTARTRSRTPTTSLRAFSPFSINRREHAAAAAAASASEDHAPPTFPPSFSADKREGAMTSEDDIKSIPALDAVSDAAEDDDVEFDGGFSMRSFTAARFKDINSSVWGPNTELETKNATAKMDNADRRKIGGPSGSSVPGIDVKADEIKIFTGYGAYSAREERLKREEEEGRLKFVWVSNDGVDQHMIWLIGLKNIFAKQLPKMPKKQIVRLVMDRSHKSVIVIKYNKVVGGITYRPFVSQKFGEIAFGAIRADEQAKGYGMRMMNHLKQYARDVDGLTHFLTYADNTAIGYFVKQGFTGEISLEKDQWHGYIKDYDGGILMECKIEPNVQFTDLSTLIHLQMQAIEEKVRELAHFDIVYPGIDFEKKEAGIPEKIMKVEDIPGLIETGWTPEQWGKSGYRTLNPSTDRASNQKFVTEFMRSLLKSMHDHADAWLFKEPVDVREVPDYYEIIEDPMDLTTMSKRVESGKYYSTLEMFLADAKRMFANAHNYNAPETKYYKCATRLNAYFQSQVQLGLESASIKIQQQ